MIEIDKRFKFENGAEMNGHYKYGILTRPERYICCRLQESGPVGIGQEQIEEFEIPIADVEALVDAGIVKKAPLIQFARELTTDKVSCEEMEDLRKQGAPFALENEWDKTFFSSFDWGLEVVKKGELPENQKMHYQVKPRLYNYISLLL